MSQKRTILVDKGGAPADPAAEESVFSSVVSPCELYQEMVSSYCATCVVDVSPGQGEFLKGCLALRTKAVAIAGTDAHCSHLELLLTDYILSELSREGSTFYRPEAVPKEEGEEATEATEATPKAKGKAKAKADPKAAGKKRPKKPKQEDEEEEEEPAPKKKPRKGKKADEVNEEEEEEEASEDAW